MGILDRIRGKAAAPKTAKPEYNGEPVLGMYLKADGTMAPVTAKSGWSSGYANYYGAYSKLAIDSTPQGYAYGYVVSVWANRCIEIRSSIIGRMPHKVVSKRTGKPVPNHPLTVALLRSQQNILRKIEWSRLIWGETFIWPVQNTFHYFSDLWWLNNLGVSVVQGAGYIKAINFIPVEGGKPEMFQPSQIAFMKTDNPFSDLRGLSPMEAVLLDVGVDKDVARTLKAWYTNDARPGMLFIPENDLLPGAAQEFTDYWKENFQGTDKAGRMGMLPRNVKEIKEMNRAPNIDDVEIREAVRRDICAGFGVPLSIAGAWDDANYQSAPEQRKSLYEDTIIPECEDIASDINNKLLPFFDDSGNTRFEFDVSKILALMEDTEQKEAMLSQRLVSGGLMLNEYRLEIGKEPIPGGDVLFIPTTVTVTPIEKIGQPVPQVAYGIPQDNLITAQPVPDVGNAPPIKPPAALQAPAQPKQIPAQTQPGKAVDDSAFVYLPLPNNTELTAIQTQLRVLLGDTVDWQDPATFHVTLLYCTSISDHDLAEIATRPVVFDGVQLSGSRLGLFSTDPNAKALHIVIDNHPSLTGLQRTIFNYFDQAGFAGELSSFSTPGQYNPHITMGYLPADIDMPVLDVKFSALVQAFEYGRNEYQPFAAVNSAPQLPRMKVQGKHFAKRAIQNTVIDELNAWEKKTLQAGTKKAARFECFQLPAEVQTVIREQLAALPEADKPTIKALFAKARTVLSLSELGEGKKKFDLLNEATRQESLEYWQHYDSLQSEVASTWLNDYEDRVLNSLLARLHGSLTDGEIEDSLAEFQGDLVNQWIGTAEKPGSLLAIAIAGMTAGQAALERNTAANPNKPQPVKAINIAIDWALLPQEALDFLQRYAFNLIKRINDTTKSQIRKVVDAWIQSGAPLEDLRQALIPVLKDPIRAANIAESESGIIYNEAAFQRWTNVGVSKARWVTVMDDLVCAICRRLNGQISDINTGWTDPLTGQVYRASAHPRDRCFRKPVL
jgi:HK97 family phage portal protein